MKRALIRNNLILSSLSFFVFFIVVSLIVYRYDIKKQEDFMGFIIDEVHIAYQLYEGPMTDFVLESSTKNDRRITILDSSGIVIVDSHDEQVGTDKSMRPEIKDIGRVVRRHSDTIDVDLIYLAKRLDDGNILRVSIPLEPLANAYNLMFLWLIFGGVFVIVIDSLILRKLSLSFYQPWISIRDNMRSLSHSDYQVLLPNTPYPEINQIIDEMNTINLDREKHLKDIESYQSQLLNILNAIKQAIILIDGNGHMIYHNDDADILFKMEVKNSSYYYNTIRHSKINQSIEESIKLNKRMHFDYPLNGRTYEISIFPVAIKLSQKQEATTLFIARNVSEERSLERMKRDFFSHASHELKSPLTAIKGYAELIELSAIKGDEVPQIAKKINDQVNMMDALVEDMLMLSRLEHIQEKPVQRIELKPLLDDVLSQLNPLIKEKNMTVEITTNDPVFTCDPLDFHKVFKNVIENSIKYSHSNKTIEIMLKDEQKHIIFSVKDQGFGIAKEHKDRIFERFYRIDKGRLDGGTGLGLAIVKHVVIKYDGKIELESSLASGTKMTIILPNE